MNKVTLIIGDSLRRDYVSFYGEQDGITTPNIDSIAEKSYVFFNCRTLGPDTTSSTTHLLLGERDVIVNTVFDTPPESDLLREIKSKALISGMAFVDRWAVQFDYYHSTARTWPNEDIIRTYQNILKHKREIDFIYLHSFLPHNPYAFSKQQALFELDKANILDNRLIVNPEKFRKLLPPVLELYKRGVFEFDTLVKEIHETDKTRILIIAADHGESFGENNWYGHGMINEAVCRIPLIIKIPESLIGYSIPAEIDNSQIIRTIIELLYDYDIPDGLCRYFHPQPRDPKTIERLRKLGYLD